MRRDEPAAGPRQGGIAKKCGYFKGVVDAVNLTDNQTAIVRMSSAMASALALAGRGRADNADDLPRPQPPGAAVRNTRRVRGRCEKYPLSDGRLHELRQPPGCQGSLRSGLGAAHPYPRRYERGPFPVRRRDEATAGKYSSAARRTHLPSLSTCGSSGWARR